MSFHNAGFIGGNLPNTPVESHAAYTQRGAAHVTEASKASVQRSDPSDWRGLCLDGHPSPAGGCGDCVRPVEWESGGALRVPRGAARLQRWGVGALSTCSPLGVGPHSRRCPDGVLIQVPRLVIGGSVPLRRTFPLHPILSVPTEHLTPVVADSDSTLITRSVQGICSALPGVSGLQPAAHTQPTRSPGWL